MLRANAEDDCTGRFWEGRFKSQALLDEASLAACMAYVDLNPIRAKIAATPETSDYTSIKKRIKSAKKGEQPNRLLPFSPFIKNDMPPSIPFELKSYLELVELTGRCIRLDKRSDKKGVIDESESPILERLSIDAAQWLDISSNFETLFKGAVGKEECLTAFSEHTGHKKRYNVKRCREYFG